MDRVKLVERLYAAYNRRDVDDVLGLVRPDVQWVDGLGGGAVVGREELRDHWRRQWRELNATVVPVSADEEGADDDGRDWVRLTVNQAVRTAAGDLLSEREAQHRFTFGADGLVTRLEIDPD